MAPKQFVALLAALAGIIVMGYVSSGESELGNPILGLFGALLCVLGWGSEAVICAWGMRDDAVDNETALQIRETTSRSCTRSPYCRYSVPGVSRPQLFPVSRRAW